VAHLELFSFFLYSLAIIIFTIIFSLDHFFLDEEP
jgi:hypothetical protein